MTPRTPVEAAIIARRVELGIAWTKLIAAADVSHETLRKIRLHGTQGVEATSVDKVEAALQVEPGSIAAVERGDASNLKALSRITSVASGQPNGSGPRPHVKETITVEERRDGSGLVDYTGRWTIVGSGPDRIDREINHVVQKSDLTDDMDDWIIDRIQNAFRRWSAEDS